MQISLCAPPVVILAALSLSVSSLVHAEAEYPHWVVTQEVSKAVPSGPMKRTSLAFETVKEADGSKHLSMSCLDGKPPSFSIPVEWPATDQRIPVTISSPAESGRNLQLFFDGHKTYVSVEGAEADAMVNAIASMGGEAMLTFRPQLRLKRMTIPTSHIQDAWKLTTANCRS